MGTNYCKSVVFTVLLIGFVQASRNCPENCDCLIKPSGAITVQCSQENLTSMPPYFPAETDTVVIKNNKNLKWPSLGLNKSNWRNVTYFTFENNAPVINLTIETIQWLASVKVLSLRLSGLRHLEEGLFGALPNLRLLDVSMNAQLELDSIFNSLSSNNTQLEVFNISFCNKLPRQQIIFAPRHFVKLRHSPIRILDMTSVNLYNIEPGISVFLPELEVFNVSHNHMTIDMRILCQIALLKKLYVFDISFWKMPDPFYKVKGLDYGNNADVVAFKKEIDQTISACRIDYGSSSSCFPLAESLRLFYFHHIKWSSAESPSIRKCLSPNNMTKVWINNNNYRLFNGSIQGAELVTLLDMSENKIEYMKEFMVHEPVVEVLNLSSNRFYKMENLSEFGDLVRTNRFLQHFDFSQNNLHNLPFDMFTNNTHLVSIDLSRNSLQDFKLDLRPLPYLRHVDLSSNSLKTINEHTRQQFDQLVLLSVNDSNTPQFDISEDVPPFHKSKFTIDLSNNVFQCQCNNIQFILWLKTTNVSLVGHHNYTCVLNGEIVSVSIVDESVILKTCDMTVEEIAMVISLILCLCLLSIVLSYIIVKKVKTLLMQRQIQKYKGSSPPKYVAFMCYSHHDSEFVMRHLRPEIERRLEVDMSRSEGLLCINDRDFRVGEPIEEAIVRSVLASSMIILVISEKFMESQWCKFEMNIAWLEKKPILMILKEKVLVRKLPYLLKNIYNKNTRLTWTGETRKNEFIENLYKSMLNKL